MGSGGEQWVASNEVNPECRPIVSAGRLYFGSDNRLFSITLANRAEPQCLLVDLPVPARVPEVPPQRPSDEVLAVFIDDLTVDPTNSTLAGLAACYPGKDLLVQVDLTTRTHTKRPLDDIVASSVCCEAGLAFTLFASGPRLESLDGQTIEDLPGIPEIEPFPGPVTPRSVISRDGQAVVVSLGWSGVSVFVRGSTAWTCVEPLGREPAWSRDGKELYFLDMTHGLHAWNVETGQRRVILAVDDPAAEALARPRRTATGLLGGSRALRPAVSHSGRYILTGVGDTGARDLFVVDLEEGLVSRVGPGRAISACWLEE